MIRNATDEPVQRSVIHDYIVAAYDLALKQE